MTAEQVCRALRYVVRVGLIRDRGTDERAWVLAVITYHQRRNRAATDSKHRRVVRPRTRKKPRKPRPKRSVASK